VADEGRCVQPEGRQPVEEIPERGPVVVEPAVERVHGVEHGLAMLAPEGRRREPAVAGDEGGHALLRLLGRERVDRQIEVVVGVHVDEAGAHHPPLGAENASRLDAPEAADLDDPATRHPNVRRHRGRAGAVEHEAAADHEVEHACPPLTDRRQRPRPAGPETGRSGASENGRARPAR
jgi:hypothetical protein